MRLSPKKVIVTTVAYLGLVDFCNSDYFELLLEQNFLKFTEKPCMKLFQRPVEMMEHH